MVGKFAAGLGRKLGLGSTDSPTTNRLHVARSFHLGQDSFQKVGTRPRPILSVQVSKSQIGHSILIDDCHFLLSLQMDARGLSLEPLLAQTNLCAAAGTLSFSTTFLFSLEILFCSTKSFLNKQDCFISVNIILEKIL